MYKYLMKCLFVLTCLTPLPLFGQSGDTALYKIYSVVLGREITMDQLIDNLQQQDVIFFGEEHNDSIAHVLELRLLKGLHDQGKRKIILSMEMFQSDIQLVLDEYRNGLINERSFNEDAKLWNNYRDYRPLVTYARKNGIYILAANAPGRYANLVARGGLESLDALTKQAKSYLAPLPIDTLTGPYYEKFTEAMGGHGGMGSLHLYQAQNLWDATMAWHIAQAMKRKRKKKQVLHLTGRFHSDEKLGTYKQLEHYSRRLRRSNISVFSDTSIASPSWEKWEDLGDYIIITRPTHTFPR